MFIITIFFPYHLWCIIRLLMVWKLLVLIWFRLLVSWKCFYSLHCTDKAYSLRPICSLQYMRQALIWWFVCASIDLSYSPTLEPGVPYNVSVRAMNGAPQSGVDTVIIAYVAQRRKFSFYVLKRLSCFHPLMSEWDKTTSHDYSLACCLWPHTKWVHILFHKN